MTADKETLRLAEVYVNHCCFRFKQNKLDFLIAVTGNYGQKEKKKPPMSPFAFPIAIYLVSSYTGANLKAFIPHTSLVDLLFLCLLGEFNSHCKIQYIHTHTYTQCMSTPNANILWLKNKRKKKEILDSVYDHLKFF
jgi:hypothetical protein